MITIILILVYAISVCVLLYYVDKKLERSMQRLSAHISMQDIEIRMLTDFISRMMVIPEIYDAVWKGGFYSTAGNGMETFAERQVLKVRPIKPNVEVKGCKS